MEAYSLFLNDAGRVRSGWRLGLFVLAFVILLFLLGTVGRVLFVIGDLLHIPSTPYLENIVFRLIFLAAAIIAGWICQYWLEGLPWRALGLYLHPGWLRDLLIGSLIGALSLAIAALVAFVAGGLRFALSENVMLFVVARGLVTTAFLLMFAALAEEALFRGYPLQTLTRAHFITLGVLLTSVPFGLVHLRNPNVAAGFTFINTALAGVWLAAAYLRTRSLWFPLGVHWSWNWAQGAIFGVPVSGLVVSDHPLLQSIDKGPAWLTGGSYGLEGGLCCTIALLLSTIFILRTRLVSATPELLKLTSEENPAQPIDVR